MAAFGDIRCELLCYVQNNFDKCSKASLITTISGFYDVEEIVSAKTKLFEVFNWMTFVQPVM